MVKAIKMKLPTLESEQEKRIVMREELEGKG